MALPFSANTTYVAGSTPTIKAQDLNQLQDYTVHVFQGTKTLKKLQIDGVSDQAVVVTDGTARLTAPFSGTGGGAGNPSLPLTTLRVGELCGATVPVAWAVINSAGTLLRGVNITGDITNVAATLRVAAGVYTFTTGAQPTDTTNACVLVTPFNSDRKGSAQCNGFGGFLQVTVTISDSADAPQDSSFQVVVFAA